jgi:hypothetical protein
MPKMLLVALVAATELKVARLVAVTELSVCTSALRASVVPPDVTPSMTTTVFSVVSTQSSARVPTTEANPVVDALRNIRVFAMLIPVLSHIYLF